MMMLMRTLVLLPILAACTGCTILLPMAASSTGATDRKVVWPAAADLPVGERVRLEMVDGEVWRGEIVSYDIETQRLHLHAAADDFGDAQIRSVPLDSVWILNREDRGKVKTIMATGLLLDAAGTWLLLQAIDAFPGE